MAIAKKPLAHPMPPAPAESPFESGRYKEIIAFLAKMGERDKPVRPWLPLLIRGPFR
jgi:hypothetical protein